MKLVDRTGQKFGRLTVIEQAGRSASKKVLWKCQCECGNETVVSSGALVTGNTVSCGCYLKERITKHGGWNKASYNTWRAMMRRCYTPKDKDYKRYGAVGVIVQDSWHEYAVFAADMGEPQGDQTLHRINPYGNYTTDNCAWASPTRQAREIRLPRRSKTGFTGVLFHGGRYYATVTVNKKKYYSKCFHTIEEAVAARKELERLHWKTA